jgi:hypothetical protein
MIIHIEICDVCKLIVRGGLPVDTYSSGELRWDVCRGCDSKAFSSSHARWHNATWPVLKARVDALVANELMLMRDS